MQNHDIDYKIKRQENIITTLQHDKNILIDKVARLQDTVDYLSNKKLKFSFFVAAWLGFLIIYKLF